MISYSNFGFHFYEIPLVIRKISAVHLHITIEPILGRIVTRMVQVKKGGDHKTC